MGEAPFRPATPGRRGQKTAVQRLSALFFLRLLPRTTPAAEPAPKTVAKGEAVTKSAFEKAVRAADEHLANGFLVHVTYQFAQARLTFNTQILLRKILWPAGL